MSKAGGVIGIIAGIFGVIAAIVTLFFGGLGSAVGTQGAGTVVGLGWGGVVFSFLAIVFGAVVFAKPKGAGIALVVTSILGAVLGGTLVAIFMALSMIGGVLAILGAKGKAPSTVASSETVPTGPKKKTGLWIGGALGVIAVLVILGTAGKGNGDKGDTADPLAELAAATPSNLQPTGELSEIFSLGSKNTDLQRENKLKEITGQIIEWRLPVYEVAKKGSVYRIQTGASLNIGQSRLGSVGTFVDITPRRDADRTTIEGLKTGDLLSFKGRIAGSSFRSLEIKPAVLSEGPVAKKPADTVVASTVLPDGSTVTTSQGAPSPAAPKQEDNRCSNSDDPMQCLDKEFVAADKLLNETYKQVMARMDASQKATLKKAQLAWISEKEDKCEKAGVENAGGQLERIQIAECMLRMTEKRTSYLRGVR
ncbi:MAG: lysozyme inhibitor LprI family protein [Polaromonas sp.]|uniref:lysozyme inhibitor LprI family protein n=1 Tax=Polaromonas sp. TaxID=1869339 RepID=UPI002728C2D8|nr:lysozyme inhibitor LprI family protein [Polaromonas sp.]MDO9114976.1 lysozyme inhibitor LprI family protein [Polaromonas sp.]MDP1885564.1 lysozyme inhibitor LprI family protein [Polaromonas sp.]MDP3224038.1 lysozyme inhibitor LprI family protein [Rubrivivax sp.]